MATKTASRKTTAAKKRAMEASDMDQLADRLTEGVFGKSEIGSREAEEGGLLSDFSRQMRARVACKILDSVPGLRKVVNLKKESDRQRVLELSLSQPLNPDTMGLGTIVSSMAAAGDGIGLKFFSGGKAVISWAELVAEAQEGCHACQPLRNGKTTSTSKAIAWHLERGFWPPTKSGMAKWLQDNPGKRTSEFPGDLASAKKKGRSKKLVPPGATSTTTPAGIERIDPAARAAKRNGKASTTPAIDHGPRATDSREVPLDLVDPNPFQPRREFSESDLAELAESLKTHGLAQPVLVRPHEERYELIAGERRVRAARLAGWTAIAAVVRDLSDAEAAEIALIENLHRKDLSAIDKALAYQREIQAGRQTVTSLAEKLGLSQGEVSNTMRLLRLPEAWQKRVISQEMSPSHARLLVPYAKHPAILKAVEDRFFKVKGDEGVPSVEGFADDLAWRVEGETRSMEEKEYDHKTGQYIPVFTPASQAEREALGIVELRKKEWRGGKQKEVVEERATNVKLWSKLQEAHAKKWAETHGSKEERKKASAKAKVQQKKELTPAYQKAKAKEQAEIFRKRLGRWKADWLRYLLWRYLSFAPRSEDLAGGRRLAAAVQIAVYLSLHGRQYTDRGTTCDWGERDDALAWLMGKKSGRYNPNQESASGRTFLKVFAEEVPSSAIRFTAGLLWDEKEKRPVFSMPDQAIEALAATHGIDVEEAWSRDKAGPLTEAYFHLHSKEQLEALAGELGVFVNPAKPKSVIVQQLVGASSKQMPKELAVKEGRKAR